MSSRYDELERLHRLRESGALTDEEYQVEKRRLLGHDSEAPARPKSSAEWSAEPSAEVVEGEAPQSRTALYVVLGAIGLVVAIAIGLLLGRDVSGGRAAPESNVALAENAASADENLFAPPPPA